MKVFVTGATGLLGRRVVGHLVRAGYEVSAHVRSRPAALRVDKLGACPRAFDLFAPDEVIAAVRGNDVVVHLATSVPTGARTTRPGAWSTNDRLRREAANHLATAAIQANVSRYVGESITFAYRDVGRSLLTESSPQDFTRLTATSADAEQAARRVADAGAAGVALRFGLHFAADGSATQDVVRMARRGRFALFGDPDAYVSFVDIDDAAAAVVHALRVPSGVYNVVEADPRTRGEHAEALALLVGRQRLRPLSRAVRWFARDLDAALCRSQRVSATAFSEASGWIPVHSAIAGWTATRFQ